MSANHFIVVVLFIVTYFFLPMSAGSHPCSARFQPEAKKRHMENCKKKTLGAEFGWSYHNATRTLDILFGAKLDSDMGWLAWGMNPGEEAKMEGTRALIGLKLENQTLAHNTYNVTHFTKIGCGLQPSKIDLEILSFSFFYEGNIDFYIIEASIVLPSVYNISRMNFVWQIGEATAGMEPIMHPHNLANLDSKVTMDLISGDIISYGAHPLEKLRMAHGILNIVGWGTLLPIGVIIARYCRKYPIQCKTTWFVLHVSCQILGWILGTSGWILGIFLGNASKYYGFTTHRTLAIIIFTFTTLQMFALRLKPKREDEYRTHWNMYHHFLGYALLAIISANIFQGIGILTTQHIWKWAYIGLLVFQGLIALCLECFTWIKFWLDRKKAENLTNDEQRKDKSQSTPQIMSSDNQNASQPHEISKDINADAGTAGLGGSQLDRM